MIHPRIVSVLRILFGLFLILLALIHFGQDAPGPNETQAALDFEQAVINTGYLLKVMSLVELVAAGLLLSNRLVAVALILTFPIMLNFFLFKLFLDRSTLPVAAALMLVQLVLMYANRVSYAGLFTSRTITAPDSEEV